jgi:hypothetical protein
VPPIIASLFLLSVLQPAPLLQHLRIDLVFVGSILPIVETTAVTEAASIWAPYNVDLHEISPGSSPDGGLRLSVVVAHSTDRRLPLATLGAIRFRNGMPEPTILMYSQTIDAIVSTAPQLRGDRDCLPAVHNLMVGRAFGRALAHEIGHYLLRWRGHAPAGLMRATHRSLDLIDPERQGFDLSAEEVARIGDVFALSHEE